MAFADPEPLAQFLERRVSGLELQPAINDADAPPSQKQVEETTIFERPTSERNNHFREADWAEVPI